MVGVVLLLPRLFLSFHPSSTLLVFLFVMLSRSWRIPVCKHRTSSRKVNITQWLSLDCAHLYSKVFGFTGFTDCTRLLCDVSGEIRNSLWTVLPAELWSTGSTVEEYASTQYMPVWDTSCFPYTFFPLPNYSNVLFFGCFAPSLFLFCYHASFLSGMKIRMEHDRARGPVWVTRRFVDRTSQSWHSWAYSSRHFTETALA